MSKEDDILITIPLSEYVDAKLGSGTWNNRSIDREIAELIEHVCKNTYICSIQWPDKYNGLTKPLLWPIKEWREATERWEAERKRSDERRVLKFIFEANVKIVLKKVKSYFNLDDVFASTIAVDYLIKGKFKAMRLIGVEKLIEKESEL